MKIAILLLCHKIPQQINRLLKVMNYKEFHFFIHIDKKNEFADLISKQENVTILPKEKSIEISWAGFSMIQATIKLIKYAYNYEEFDFYWLCSGQDFPIKSPKKIIQFFEQNQGYDFLNLYYSRNNVNSNGAYEGKYDKRNDIYYKEWMMGTSLIRRIIKRLYVQLTGGYNRTFKIFRNRKSVNRKFYFGSQWWCFRKEVIGWMLFYLKEHKEYIDFYKCCVCPDESFFHTLYMNSPYKSYRKEYLHYIDWSERRNSPKVLVLEDYNKIINSEYLMARKFDINMDSELIKQLEENIFL